MKAAGILTTLKEAGKGILFRSDTDAPFEAFAWPDGQGKPDKARVLELAGLPPTTAVRTKSLEAFFDEATLEEDWHDEEEKQEVEKNKQLVKSINAALADVKVFETGRGVEKDVYIVGRAEAGWAGLKTKVVES
jgi:hypothetical protein